MSVTRHQQALLWLALWLASLGSLLGSFPVHAQPLAPALSDPPAGMQALVVVLVVNGEARGERVVHWDGAQAFYLGREGLQSLIRLPEGLPSREIDGEVFVALSDVPGARPTFNESTLTLEVLFPPELFAGTGFNLDTRRSSRLELLTGRSALFNYRLEYADSTAAGSGTLTLATEQAFTAGSWRLENQTLHAREPQASRSQRFFTRLVRDDVSRLRRWVIGDSIAVSGELGGGVEIGGLGLSKAYVLSPNFVRRPSAGFAGNAVLPSEVEFYVDDTRVLREQVSPGPFDIRNFSYFGGQRDIRVVVRDSLGREQTFAFPFYFADQGLARGLHDYSYQIGRIRRNLGVASNDYGDLAFSAFHQYGFTDRLTLGLRAEGSRDLLNLGPTLVWSDPRLGVLAASYALSRDRRLDQQGQAFSLAHSYQSGDFSSLVALRQYSDDYVVLHAGTAPVLPRQSLTLGFSYATSAYGSFSAGYDRIEARDDADMRRLTLGYNRRLGSRLNLFATVRRLMGMEEDTELLLGLRYNLGREHSASSALRYDEDGQLDAQFQWSRALPMGEGLGYRLALEHLDGPDGSQRSLSPEFQYNTRHASFAGRALSVSGVGGGDTFYNVSVAGSLAAVGGEIVPGRLINDSYGLARITPPLAGVRVYQNGQEVGVTDGKGQVFLPGLNAYTDNGIALDQRDIPIDFGVSRLDQIVVPPFRAGVVADFAIQRTRAFAGLLRYRVNGETRPLEYHQVMLKVGDEGVNFQSVRDGEFYLENVPPGSYPATVRIGERNCEFTLALPDSQDAFVELDEVMTCEVAN